MPSIDTRDSIDIQADARKIFDVIIDYPRMHTWFPMYRCELIDANAKAGVGEGSRLRHALGPSPFVMRRFVRTVRKIVPGRRIEETYDEGQLRGTGVWTFEPQGKATKVTYHCAVHSQGLMMHVGFVLTGAKGHNLVYQKLLRALKKRCESK